MQGLDLNTALDRHFPRYREHDPLVPVWSVTPERAGCIHRFFDSSPISPNGRFLALTRFPYENHAVRPGDCAEIVLVDLEQGGERVIAQSHAWDTQLGAQVQWGADERELFFNDLTPGEWQVFGVQLDPTDGDRRSRLPCSIYQVSRDGRRIASPDMAAIRRAQEGYGAHVPDERFPRNHGVPEDAGLTVWERGNEPRLISLRHLADCVPDRPSEDSHDCYHFHVKWRPDSDRLLSVIRFLPREADGQALSAAIGIDPDGHHRRLLMAPNDWRQGGHHPEWSGDGSALTMNLMRDGVMRFVRVADHDGGGIEVIAADRVGSGHPTLHPDRRHLVTDCYLHEPMADQNGLVPLRWIDCDAGSECAAVQIPSKPPHLGEAGDVRWRVDPHPAWDRSWRYVTFNACPNGERRVFIADMAALLDAS